MKRIYNVKKSKTINIRSNNIIDEVFKNFQNFLKIIWKFNKIAKNRILLIKKKNCH